MSVFIARNPSKGFTLLEMMIVLMLAGIMAAIATPSFLAMNNNSKITDAVEQTQGALQEAQTQAMRKSQSCSVKLVKIGQKINTTDTTSVTTPVLRGNPPSCLITGDRTLTGIVLDHNVTANSNNNQAPLEITFDYKGRTNAITTDQKVFFSVLNTPGTAKCITISKGIGLFRIGKKSGTDDCNTTQLN
ncbi:MAG: prepilin-type N-terminal cleavage/methylation domain-containing protein [Crinalium sp.]